MTSHHSHRRRTDAGLTLVEMLVAISVIGLIATVIAAVVGAAVKNNPAVELRTDTAHTLQGVVTWLPQDIDSTPPTGFDMGSTTPSGCAESPGTNLLHLQWTERLGGVTTTFVANYRWVVDEEEHIVRVTCNWSSSSGLSETRVSNASGPLTPMPASWVPGTLPAAVSIETDPVSGDVTLVTFEVQTMEGEILHVDAAPKNPANTLPPTTLGGSPPPATTVLATTTTTTTVPAVTTTVEGTTTSSTTSTTTTTTLPPCLLQTVTMSNTQIANTDPNGNGKSSTNVGVLKVALTITAQVTGYCTGLVANASTGAPNGELFHNFSTNDGFTYTVTFPGYPQGSSELWKDGNRTITFTSPFGGPHGSVTLNVR